MKAIEITSEKLEKRALFYAFMGGADLFAGFLIAGLSMTPLAKNESGLLFICGLFLVGVSLYLQYSAKVCLKVAKEMQQGCLNE